MNIYDIAKNAGVSVATVSRVVNRNGNVSRKTKEKVDAVIKELGYKPNAQARRLSTQKNFMIGVMIPDLSNPFFQTMLVGITDEANKSDYGIALYNTKESVQLQCKSLQRIMEERLSGLIAIPVEEEDENTKKDLNWLSDNGVPVVLIDRNLKGVNFDRVFSNDFKGSVEAVNSLIENGHRRIATITGPLSSKPGRDRYEGYMTALSNAGIAADERYIKYGDFMIETAYNLMDELFRLPKPPTAVFSANNLTTLGVIKYLFEKKLVIGEDVSLLGFDEIEILAYTDIKISVVDRPVLQMGIEAMNLLKDRMKKEERHSDKIHTKKIVVDTTLILRGSEKLKKSDE